MSRAPARSRSRCVAAGTSLGLYASTSRPRDRREQAPRHHGAGSSRATGKLASAERSTTRTSSGERLSRGSDPCEASVATAQKSRQPPCSCGGFERHAVALVPDRRRGAHHCPQSCTSNRPPVTDVAGTRAGPSRTSSNDRRGLRSSHLVAPTGTLSGRRVRGGPRRPRTPQRFAARRPPVFPAPLPPLLRPLHFFYQFVQAPLFGGGGICPPPSAPVLRYS